MGSNSSHRDIGQKPSFRSVTQVQAFSSIRSAANALAVSDPKPHELPVPNKIKDVSIPSYEFSFSLFVSGYFI